MPQYQTVTHLIPLLVLVLLLLFTPGCSSSETKSQPQTASITISKRAVPRKISPLLFGSNLQWTDNGDQVANLSDPDIIKELGITSIRFPGGALANTYLWKNTIGAHSKRSKGLNYIQEKEASLFGIDEFTRLCHKLSIHSVITINPSDSIQNITDLVQYMNGNNKTKWGKVRSQNNGKSKCYTQYWEIGNEIYTPDTPGFTDAKSYTQRANKIARAMKKVDPKIQIGVVIEASFLQAAWLKSVLPHMVSWNKEVLQNLSQDIDFLSVHYYAPFDTLWSSNALTQLVWSSTKVMTQNINQIIHLAKKITGRNLKVGLTEYGTFFGEKISPSERIKSTENALFLALILFNLIESNNILIANNWSLLNNSRFGLLKLNGNSVKFRPSAYLFLEIASLQGFEFLPVKVNSPFYSVAAKGNIPALRVQSVKALAVSTHKGLSVLLINRSTKNHITTRINIPVATEAYKTMYIKQYKPNDSFTSLTWKTQTHISNLSETDTITLPPGSFTRVDFRAD